MMNEKEIEKMRKEFMSAFGERIDQMGSYASNTCEVDSDEVWQYVEALTKEAYYQGYMAGTMEAL